MATMVHRTWKIFGRLNVYKKIRAAEESFRGVKIPLTVHYTVNGMLFYLNAEKLIYVVKRRRPTGLLKLPAVSYFTECRFEQTRIMEGRNS